MNDIDEILFRSVRGIALPAPLAPWAEIERRARGARRPRWLRRGLVLVALTAALAAALLFGVSGGSGPSPLERASAAVADWPPNNILYTREHMVSHFPQADMFQETWQLTSPPYTTRTRSWYGSAVPSTPIVESVVDADGFGQGFDWRSSTVLETSDVPGYWRSEGVSQATRAQLEGWIANVHARSLGESEVDGHHVVGFAAFGRQRLFLDAATYLPVLSQSFGSGTGEERLGYDQHYSWELIPASPENRGLLDLTIQHAGATVRTLTGDAWRDAEFEIGRLLPALHAPGA